METQRETPLPVAEFSLAAALALTVLAAGLGHLLRRRFRRGLVWLGLFAGTLALSSYTAPRPFVVSVATGSLSAMNVAVPGSITVLGFVDLSLLARAERRE